MTEPAYRTPTGMDPTPPLKDFLEAYQADDNEWWRIECGHHQNLFDAATEELDRLQVRIDAALSLHPRIDHTSITPEFSCEECGVHYPCPTVRALTGDN